ncbi:hypothetical protein Q3W71_10265 [Micromonospora sp. C28SCA-DRY-2]|uniref:hypothetical protein n=1 Tax=Micromonospora sp. C28SCA-DRY-2 TaxID=3059522 RepID=UPI002676ECB5|nr:hypothetical protein [Micromonospora sp. C28SCA-DRY-2]MDO3702060.1 hypothetical protein [Micromonospora sp. C28SCA-DRY-2]
MAKHRASVDDSPSGEEVAGSPDAAYWSVDDSRWPALRPDLPPDVVDLLAPPIVVGVARVPATSRLTPPAADRPAPVAARPAPAGPSRPAVPAPLGSPIGSADPVGPVGGRRGPHAPSPSHRRPVSTGRHRRQAGSAERTD